VPTSVSIRIIDGTSLKNKNGDDPFIHILFIKLMKIHVKLKKKKNATPHGKPGGGSITPQGANTQNKFLRVGLLVVAKPPSMIKGMVWSPLYNRYEGGFVTLERLVLKNRGRQK
jgi:hypothetical protein